MPRIPFALSEQWAVIHCSLASGRPGNAARQCVPPNGNVTTLLANGDYSRIERQTKPRFNPTLDLRLSSRVCEIEFCEVAAQRQSPSRCGLHPVAQPAQVLLQVKQHAGFALAAGAFSVARTQDQGRTSSRARRPVRLHEPVAEAAKMPAAHAAGMLAARTGARHEPI